MPLRISAEPNENFSLMSLPSPAKGFRPVNILHGFSARARILKEVGADMGLFRLVALLAFARRGPTMRVFSVFDRGTSPNWGDQCRRDRLRFSVRPAFYRCPAL